MLQGLPPRIKAEDLLPCTLGFRFSSRPGSEPSVQQPRIEGYTDPHCNPTWKMSVSQNPLKCFEKWCPMLVKKSEL